ncbi:MAG: hypothetical protein FWH22_08850, partial [Fibromonadales bacterium]|nr:hypothetical protein [Fibromonadales bacterium]
AAESSQWFHSIIPSEKILHALPTVSFNCKYSEQGIEAQIQTTDDKKFTISLNRKSAENAI